MLQRYVNTQRQKQRQRQKIPVVVFTLVYLEEDINIQIEEAIHAYLYLKPLKVEDSFKRRNVKKKKGKTKEMSMSSLLSIAV